MITSSSRHPSVSRGMSSTGDMPAEPAGLGAVSRARPGNRLLIFCVLTAALFITTGTSGAFAANWGSRYLTYGSCCSGQVVHGTRADISVHQWIPLSTDCLLYDSVVSLTAGGKQLEVGLGRCGASTSLDGTCSLTNNGVKYVERYNGSSYVCFPHGAASLDVAYKASLTDTSGGAGIYYSYIDGTQYEGQSGYNNNVTIYEWAEETDGVSCGLAWDGNVTHETWQRWNGSSWVTVGSSNSQQTCWSVGALSSGTFNTSK